MNRRLFSVLGIVSLGCILLSCSREYQAIDLPYWDDYTAAKVPYEPTAEPLSKDSLSIYFKLPSPLPKHWNDWYHRLSWQQASSPIPEYSPFSSMPGDLLDSIQQLDTPEKILWIAKYSYLLLTFEGMDDRVSCSEADILQDTDFNTVLQKINQNEWIGQCGEFDVLARRLGNYLNIPTLSFKPKLQLDSLQYDDGHVLTLFYDASKQVFYPIDIQNNCYWRLSQSNQLADLKSILNQASIYRQALDSLIGGKVLFPWSTLPLDDELFFGSTDTVININKQADYFVIRKHRQPPLKIERQRSYLGITSILLGKEDPTWEDFLFNAGIFDRKKQWKADLFDGPTDLIAKGYRQIKE